MGLKPRVSHIWHQHPGVKQIVYESRVNSLVYIYLHNLYEYPFSLVYPGAGQNAHILQKNQRPETNDRWRLHCQIYPKPQPGCGLYLL